jgi:hypothetical protein
MANYQLILNIDPEVIPILRDSGQKIVIARSVSGTTELAWVAFNPLPSNKVQWNDQYALYASSTMLRSGAEIVVLAESGFPVLSGASYTFDASMKFSAPDTGRAPPGSYAIQNATPFTSYPVLTFGLAQAATINGAATRPLPQSAILVLSNTTASFTSMNEVKVWLQSSIRNSTVATPISFPSARVNFDGGVVSAALRYDRRVGVFVPQ